MYTTCMCYRHFGKSCILHYMYQTNLLSARMAVEVIWPDRFAKHDIIIHVDELVREARDVVQVALYGR